MARVRRSAPRARVSILIGATSGLVLEQALAPLLQGLDTERHEIVVAAEGGALERRTFTTPPGVRLAAARRATPTSLRRAAAEAASGEFLFWLDANLAPDLPDWLEECLGRLAGRNVGAVAPVVLDVDGAVESAGFALGDEGPLPALRGRREGDPGYADLLLAAHETSAACVGALLTPRQLYFELGGFDDARFPAHFTGADYSLRLRARGWRTICAPLARLRRTAPSSLPQGAPPEALELPRLRARWADVLSDDSCYSPLLTLDRAPFSSLASRPRRLRPRLPTTLAPRAVPPGF